MPSLSGYGKGPPASAGPAGWPVMSPSCSEGHGLRAALDLGPPVLAQRVDRPPREVVVEEEPRDALAVVVLVVVHQGEQTRQPLHHEAVLDEQGGDTLAGTRGRH